MLNVIRPFDGEVRNGIKSSFISDLENRERARMDLYIKAREYYDGIHNTQLTDRMKKFLHLDVISSLSPNENRDFNANYMPMVVNAKADRLKVIGFDVADDEAQKETFNRWWRKNRMDKTSGIVHRASIRDGDAFILCEWDNEAGIPRFYYEPAYAGSGTMVYYSEERRNEIAFASKHWQIEYGVTAGTISRLNLYFPNRIEKYIANGENSRGWMPYEDDSIDVVGDGYLGSAGIVWWTDTRTETGKPLGVPVIHFANNDNGDGFGTSHIADVMPIQDAVNKSMIDLLAVMDANGTPILKLIGLGLENASLDIGAGVVIKIPANPSDVSLDKIASENPQGLLNVYQSLVMEIGRISGTPLSYFQSSGQVAAEGTMKQQEVALITQVEKSQTDYGNAWEDVMNMGRRLHNAFSNEPELDTDMIIDTLWKQAESRNEKDQAETLLVKKELGVSDEQAQTELGYDAIQRQAFARAKIRNTALAIRRPPIIPDAQEVDDTLTQTENEDVPIEDSS